MNGDSFAKLLAFPIVGTTLWGNEFAKRKPPPLQNEGRKRKGKEKGKK